MSLQQESERSPKFCPQGTLDHDESLTGSLMFQTSRLEGRAEITARATCVAVGIG
jgi:hypothetical protein